MSQIQCEFQKGPCYLPGDQPTNLFLLDTHQPAALAVTHDKATECSDSSMTFAAAKLPATWYGLDVHVGVHTVDLADFFLLLQAWVPLSLGHKLFGNRDCI